MEFFKKNKAVIVIVIIAIVIFILWQWSKKQASDSSSGYATKCPCPGVQQPGGGMYFNTACCKKATGTRGSADNGIA